jgi:hypothetical protein
MLILVFGGGWEKVFGGGWEKVFAGADENVRYVQTAALLEVAHAALGKWQDTLESNASPQS